MIVLLLISPPVWITFGVMAECGIAFPRKMKNDTLPAREIEFLLFLILFHFTVRAINSAEPAVELEPMRSRQAGPIKRYRSCPIEIPQ
jgi:hypothetical protein